ncbi:unnamed protein product [Ranitomeya imitator]|uniref:Uncharacterized protein n=1 Tax=Ranitomeya imitator TaxID=111125 RepID=A0ABN9MLK4_9NEOB|nr:unnamed protein product [Ranitomeya imitator]
MNVLLIRKKNKKKDVFFQIFPTNYSPIQTYREYDISYFPIVLHSCDLDWKPCIRWLPSPRYSEAPLPHIKDAKFPERIRLQRSYPMQKAGEPLDHNTPRLNMRSRILDGPCSHTGPVVISPGSSLEAGSEWSFYPNFGCSTTYHVGKRCIIGGVHKSSQVGSHDHTLPMSTGRRKKVFDPRNGIPEAHPGDKPFRTVEYSPGFHKFGSTMPVVILRCVHLHKAGRILFYFC